MPEIISPIDGQPAYHFDLLGHDAVGARLTLAAATSRGWRDSAIEQRVALCRGMLAAYATQADQNAEDVDAGTVFANRCDYLDPALAWTGIKDSGFGCSLSPLGFQSVTRPKSYHLRQQSENPA